MVMNHIEVECQSFETTLLHQYPLLLWVMVGFWMCFILDMVGDEVGWKSSLWVIGVMLGVAMILQMKIWRVDIGCKRWIWGRTVASQEQDRENEATGNVTDNLELVNLKGRNHNANVEDKINDFSEVVDKPILHFKEQSTA